MGPEVLAGGSLAASALGSIVQGFGKSYEGQAGAQMSEYQAKVAENNAAIAKQNAVWERAAGESDVAKKGMQTAQVVGAEKTGQAAGGVNVNTGSAVDVRASTAQLGHLDAMTIMNNALKKAWGYDVEASSYQAEAALRRQKGKYYEESGDIGLMSSLLGGVSSVSDKWLSFRDKGIV